MILARPGIERHMGATVRLKNVAVCVLKKILDVSRHRSVNCDLNITVSIERYAEIGTVMHQPIPKTAPASSSEREFEILAIMSPSL
jgi:hypothetical protein